jgi:hypothetical protein
VFRLIAATGFGLALCVLYLGSAIWLRNFMADEYARGEAFGRAASLAQAAAEMSALRAAADAALIKTNADVAALEDEQEKLQEGLDGLARETGGNGDGPVCIGPGLVRALGALGRAGGVQPRP